MTGALQLKKVPAHIKALIDREAGLHRRSINQEVIVLLEEALLARARLQTQIQEDVEDILKRYAALPTRDARPVSDIIEYDEIGLPK
ncbi:MAG: hypothetical protein IPH35_00535 [Rhodoferax sp.]|nr:hypothetical protein [Rhodoferax sp.]